jgi:hypothetical protein
MQINYGRLRFITLFYIILPIIIFFIGWLKWPLAFILSILILLASYLVCKDKVDNEVMKLSKLSIFVIIFIAILWCFMAGQGGYFSQSDDYQYRNAIFRDLINMNWPVMYPENNSAMVYYIGHWMVPALIGKIAMYCLGKNYAWEIGNCILFLWTALGVILVTLLIIKTVKVNKAKSVLLVTLIFVLFSGLDIVGILFQSIANGRLIVVNHLEWWATIAQYSSTSTCLFWIFNQAIVPWLIILLYLNKESVKNYAFLGFSCLLYAPLPFLGIVPYFIGKAILDAVKAYKKKVFKTFLKQVLSIQNIISLFTILPIMYLFYYSNSIINSAGMQMNNNSPWGLLKTLLVTSLFIILEFALYSAAIFYDNKRNLDYYICNILLILILFFKVGSANDFTMRVSIPSLMLLMVLVIKSLFEKEKKVTKKNILMKYKKSIILGLLLLGSFTPTVEFIRATSMVIENHKLGVVADDIKSLSNQPLESISNFVTEDPLQKKFFIYFAK